MSLPAAATPDRYTLLEACRARYLDGLLLALRDAGLRNPEVQARFRGAVNTFFDERVRMARRTGFDAAQGLTASRITLVGDEQLELELRRDDICRRLYETCADSLWRLHQRCIALLQRPELDLKDNPMGPDGINAGLAELCAALELDLERTLDALDQIEVILLHQLPVLYAELTELFTQAGIHAPPRKTAHSSPPPAAPDANRVENATAPLAPLHAALPASAAPHAALTTRSSQSEQADVARYRPLIAEARRRNAALQRAQDVLRTRAPADLPPEFLAFLEDDWAHVLQAAWLQGGERGPAWQAALACIDTLFWSITPKETAEARQELAARVPLLMKEMSTALAGIGRRLEDATAFLDVCFALQTAALRGRTVARPAATGAPPTDRAAPPERLAADGLCLYVLPGHPNAAGQSHGVDLPVGRWLTFFLPGTPTCASGWRLCLVWQGSAADADFPETAAGADPLYLFLDPAANDHALLIAQSALAKALQSGHARAAA